MEKHTEIQQKFDFLTENYTPVNVIKYFDFLREQSVDNLLENSNCVIVEPKGPKFLLEKFNSTFPEVCLDKLPERIKVIEEYWVAAEENPSLDSEHVEEIKECVSVMNLKYTDFNNNETQYLLESTIRAFENNMELVAIKEHIGEMSPDVVYAEEDIPVLKKKAQLDFSVNFAKTFMDDSAEVNMESYNAMMRAGFTYDNLVESEEAVLEGTFTRKLKRTAIAGDTAARKSASSMRTKSREVRRVKHIAKKIPGHFDKMVDSTIGQIGKMDKAERRKRIVEGGFKFKLLKLIRNGIILGAAWSVGPAIAAAAILVNLILDKQLDERVRADLIQDLELELKMTKEKLKDAESKGDNKKKYQLMRIENSLERDLERVKYRLNKVRITPKGVKI